MTNNGDEHMGSIEFWNYFLPSEDKNLLVVCGVSCPQMDDCGSVCRRLSLYIIPPLSKCTCIIWSFGRVLPWINGLCWVDCKHCIKMVCKWILIHLLSITHPNLLVLNSWMREGICSLIFSILIKTMNKWKVMLPILSYPSSLSLSFRLLTLQTLKIV